MPPEQSPQPPKPLDSLKPLRTYQRDVEEMMQKEQISKATIAIAQDRKRIEEAATASPPFDNQSKIFRIGNILPLSTRWNMKLIAAVSVGICVLGGIGVGAFFFFRNNDTPPPTKTGPQVPKATAIRLQGGESRAGILKAVQEGIGALSIPQNELRIIPITVENAPLQTAELFAKLETSAPPALVRALATVPTFGVHGVKDGQAFLLFGVSSFDHAFSGMLSWEETLLEDIGPLFGVLPREILQNVGSTTTSALENTVVIKDVIIKNKDARAAFDPQGMIVFLYSFIDKQTLVFTTSEDTLRLLQSKAGGGRLK